MILIILGNCNSPETAIIGKKNQIILVWYKTRPADLHCYWSLKCKWLSINTWKAKLMRLSSCRMHGHGEMRAGKGEHVLVHTHRIAGNVVAQGHLLAGELQQAPSYITKEDALAGKKCQSWTYKSNQDSRNHLCKLDPRRKADWWNSRWITVIAGIVCSDKSGAKRDESKW